MLAGIVRVAGRPDYPMFYQPQIHAPKNVVGRDDIINRCLEYIKSSDGKAIINLTAPSDVPRGTGKTTLAKTIATELRSRIEKYNKGQMIVSLIDKDEQTLTSEEAMKLIVREVGIKSDNSGQYSAETIDGKWKFNSLREAYSFIFYSQDLMKDGVLILDDVKSLEQIQALLPKEKCSVIIMSKQPLNLSQAHFEEVGFLDRSSANRWLISAISCLGRRLATSEMITIMRIALCCAYLPTSLDLADSYMRKCCSTLDVGELYERYINNLAKHLSVTADSIRNNDKLPSDPAILKIYTESSLEVGKSLKK